MAADIRPRRVALFLDRDGVINRKAPEGDYVRNVAEFEFMPGAVQALAEIHRAGAELIVVTNQRGVARGLMTEADLNVIHQHMATSLAEAGAPLAGIYVCPHELEACDCRKPAPGLFVRAQREMPWIEFSSAHLVGDSLSDLEAGSRLGMSLWLVGDEQRRSEIERKAVAQSLALRGSARSLAALMREGPLLDEFSSAATAS